MDKVVVTGASGFIGTNLVNKLVGEGKTVYAVVRDKKKVTFSTKENLYMLECDMNDVEKLVEMIGVGAVDTFYHLAWSGSTGVDRANFEMQLKNVEFACKALRVAEDLGCCKFLCAGTITERIVEDTVASGLASPNLVYGIAKKTTKEILQTLSASMKIDVIWMQFSNVFGGNNNTGNLISYTFNQLKAGKQPEYSSACQPYDFIYIDDLIDAVYLLGESTLQHREYFVGSGNSRILREYLLQIPKILEIDIQMGIGKRADDGVIYKEEWFSTTHLQDDTNFVAGHTFEQAIRVSYRGE